MKPTESLLHARAWLFALTLTLGAVVACVIQPQPIPPFAGGSAPGEGGNETSAPGDPSGDSSPPPRNPGDGGLSTDAGTDATADAGTDADATADAGTD